MSSDLSEPTIRVLSLGAGVQSTTLALLAIEGALPKLDAAIFADTGWEPVKVYQHLDRLAIELESAGIPLYRVSQGNLREDAIDPEHRYASIPYFVRNAPFSVQEPVQWKDCEACEGWPINGCDACNDSGLVATAWRARPAVPEERKGMGRRQCTNEYKLAPINKKTRELLGAAPPSFRRVPKGTLAEQWIGFSTDEIHRVSNKFRVSYLRHRYPLLDLRMSRSDCIGWLASRGWGSTVKSACIGCPFHGNAQWRDLRDNRPQEWADAVAFDEAIRDGGAHRLPLGSEAFLHRSRIPLSIAPIDLLVRDDQPDLFEILEKGEPDGCSPYGCRSGEPVKDGDMVT